MLVNRFLKVSSIQLSLLLLITLTCFPSVFAQKAVLEGKVLDSLNQPIPHTNLIASPYQTGENVSFAIADFDGKYKLNLQTDVDYKIEITSMGFSSKIDSLSISKDTAKNYILNKSTTSLEQVVIKAKMAMLVREDTITYRTDKFVTGDERKLRDVLKKLPGVEVDRDGNVTVNGKKVSKLMVDGLDFFGGDTKLGVNHIPADAVDEVEAIDNYHEVAFMKGLSDSDRMAMNIKLKEDKKSFVFGETEAGGGVEDRYFIQPTLFYYSPKTTVNFIGSLNNINESSLNFQDVLRFSGSDLSFMDNTVLSSNENLMQFSSSTDIKHKKMQFAAANFTQRINKDLRLEAYSILAKQEVQSETESNTEYLTQESLIEERNTSGNDKGFSNFNKVRLRYTPDLFKDLAYDVLANVSNNSYRNHIYSRVADSINQTNSWRDPHSVELNQFFRYNTQPSYKHTSEVRAEHSFRKSNRHSDWDFDRPIFSDIIPIVEEDSGNYNLSQDYASTTHSGSFNFKHYWVLNSTNHLYPLAGFYFFDQTYSTEDFQVLGDGLKNDFGSAGFNNDIDYQLLNPYLGLQYKVKVGEVILRPGVVYHQYFWRVKQFQEKTADKNKGVFLPEFRLEYKPNSTQRLEFNYNLKSSFADAENYANRLSLRSFNLLYRGNEELENTLYHDFSLYYRRINISRSLNYHLTASYRRQEKSIQQATMLEGIDQISTMFYSSFPENNLSFVGRFNKRWTHISFGAITQVSFADYSRIVNDEKLDYDTQSLTYRINLRTLLRDLPNLEIGFRHNINWMQSTDFKSRYSALSPYAEIDYRFFKDFVFKMDYSYSHTKHQSATQSDNFQIANASLFYRKEDSPWGMEIRVDNIFNANYKRNYAVNQFMIYDQRIYLQPRTAMFILSYQL